MTSSKKARKPAKPSRKELLFLSEDAPKGLGPCLPPLRVHPVSYHHPLLLESSSSTALLNWFRTVESSRSMPWRKDWIDPTKLDDNDLNARELIGKRAYEVWVSETMLQQTRVSTVIPYFNKWMSKWPTIQELAEASHEDVLAVWSGLGYYSRATRLWEAAKSVVAEPSLCGILPDTPDQLQEKVKGVGPYTAGAISSIVFGRAVPLIDGNVARVLSRQLGLYANVADKTTSEALWGVAGFLVRSASGHETEEDRSDIPGKWNQALMELGSTICTPRPQCETCPISMSCRTYGEGRALAVRMNLHTEKSNIPVCESTNPDEQCTLCLPFHDGDQSSEADPMQLVDIEDGIYADATGPSKKRKPSSKAGTDHSAKRSLTGSNSHQGLAKGNKDNSKAQSKISKYFSQSSNTSQKTPDMLPNSSSLEEGSQDSLSPKALMVIKEHCSLFPKKVAKKKVPEEECVVCIIKCMPTSGAAATWLVEQRPEKGLLASLWEFPTYNLPKTNASTKISRAEASQAFVFSLDALPNDCKGPEFLKELNSVTHVFSHLKLTMHIHLYSIEGDIVTKTMASKLQSVPKRKWITEELVEDISMGTGMRKCWESAKTYWS